MDTEKKLSPISITLHWLIAICILALITFGIYMVKTESWNLYHLHKSVGLLIFIFIIARVAWRIKNGLPHPVRHFSRLEHAMAKAVHYALLVCTVLMPVTGMIYSGASGNGFGIFSLEIFPEHHSVGNQGPVTPFNAALSDWGKNLHDSIAYFLLALIVLHVAGALKHHLIDKDKTLLRMLGVQNDKR